MAEVSPTTYDDVFRTMTNVCSSLILPVINEVFGEHYTGTEEIIFRPNEMFLRKQDGDEDKKITDTSFIVKGDVPKGYHWECQSEIDHSMAVRIFEYDAQIALRDGNVVGDTLTGKFGSPRRPKAHQFP